MADIQHLNKEALNFRANANIGAASFLSGFFSLFALVPISIRQRDWKIWVIPFASAFLILVPYYDWDKEEFPRRISLLGGIIQGSVACALLTGNKNEAKRALASKGVVEAEIVIE